MCNQRRSSLPAYRRLLATFGHRDAGPAHEERCAPTRVATMPGVPLRLIEPGKPTQNAYIESFNGRFCDGISN